MDFDLGQALSASLDKVTGWVEAFIRHLPEIAMAVLVIVAFAMLAKLAKKLVRKLMDQVTDHESLKGLAATAGYVAVLTLGIFMALGILNLDKTVTSLLAGVGIVGLALGFAFQDIAENFISGILISVRRPFQQGQLIETNGYFGKVEGLDLRSTHVRTLQGQLVRIPNGEVYGNPLVNFSDAQGRRIDLSCGVSYGDDLEKARKVALEAMRDVDGRDPSREPELFYNEFGSSSINFVLRIWIASTEQKAFLATQSDAIIRLKKAFDENDIGIPFPIMTLDFSDAGTRRLDEPLQVLAGSASPDPSGGEDREDSRRSA